MATKKVTKKVTTKKATRIKPKRAVAVKRTETGFGPKTKAFGYVLAAIALFAIAYSIAQ